MIKPVTDRWQARFADDLLEQAKREIHHEKPKTTGRLMVAWVLSVIVLASPIVVMALGGGLILTTFPRVLPLIVGLILIGFGYVLLPPRYRNTQQTYSRVDLPLLFELLDDIAARMGTTAPDGIHFDGDFNAYMTHLSARHSRRRDWILGIGLAMWATLSPQQRIALLAHELGHRVSDDPMRHGVFARAKVVLENWYETFDLDRHIDAPIIQMVMTGLIGAYYQIFSWFSFFESQRAEYRADAIAAQVSGRQASHEMLEILTRADLGMIAIVDLYPYRDQQNGHIFDHMAQAIAGADGATKGRYLAEAEAQKRCVDSSHPPTSMRIEFIQSLPDTWGADRLHSSDYDFAAIDNEMRTIKDQLGKEEMQDLFDTEVNR